MRERLREHRRFLTLGAGIVACVMLAACVPPPPPPPPGTFTGNGLDTCAAPSPTVMSAWLSSPYRAIGVYIGGETRGCSQPNLNASWVSSVGNAGWHLAPLYVGLQDPCDGFFGSSVFGPTDSDAFLQGYGDSEYAVIDANNIGLGAGTPIYLDLEAYPTGGACSQLAMDFVDGWDLGLHNQNRVAGVYSSSGSGMTDLVSETPNPNFVLPNDIWFAHWNGLDTVFGDTPYIPDNVWVDHQRIHQYTGDSTESWGGYVLDIDHDAMDANLAG